MTRRKVDRAAPRAHNPDMASKSRILLPKSALRALPAPVEDPPPILVPVNEDHDSGRPTTPHLSFSQLSMYLRCSFQYRFRYKLGLKERPKVSLSIGKGGHAALEFNSKTKIRTGEDAPTEAVIQKASDMMDHYLTDLPRSEYETDVEPGSTKDKFLAATRVYRERDAPAIRPIGAEVEFNLDLNPYQPADAEPLPEPIRIVNGKIDLMFDDHETLLSHPGTVRVGITDHKYVTRKKSQAEVNLSPQLTLYGTVVKHLTGKWPTKLGLHMLHPGTKQDAPDSIPLLREPQHMTPDALTRRMARLAYQFRKAEEGIRAGIFIPTDDPISCSWCGYRERCQNSLVDDFEAAIIRQQTTPPAS